MLRPFLNVNDSIAAPITTKDTAIDQPDTVVPQTAIDEPPTGERVPATEHGSAKAPKLTTAWDHYADQPVVKRVPKITLNAEPTIPTTLDFTPLIQGNTTMSLEENQTHCIEASPIHGVVADSDLNSVQTLVVEKPKPTDVISGKTLAMLRQFSTYLTPGRAMFLGGGNAANRFQRLLESFVEQAKAKRLDSPAADRFVLAILTFHSTYRDQAIAAKKMQELVRYHLQRAWPRENPKKFIPITAVLATLYLENISLWDELLLNQESKPNETPTTQALPKQADLATDREPGEEASGAGDTVFGVDG